MGLVECSRRSGASLSDGDELWHKSTIQLTTLGLLPLRATLHDLRDMVNLGRCDEDAERCVVEIKEVKSANLPSIFYFVEKGPLQLVCCTGSQLELHGSPSSPIVH